MMKMPFTKLGRARRLALILPFLASCATSQRTLVLGPVGPEPPATREQAPLGYLKVWSATARVNAGDMNYRPHTSYEIDSMDGKLVQSVANSVGLYDEDPALVQLPAGRYIVKAESQDYGLVEVKAIIMPGQLTVINLGHEFIPGTSSSRAADLQRQPNGDVLGWRPLAPAPAGD